MKEIAFGEQQSVLFSGKRELVDHMHRFFERNFLEKSKQNKNLDNEKNWNRFDRYMA